MKYKNFVGISILPILISVVLMLCVAFLGSYLFLVLLSSCRCIHLVLILLDRLGKLVRSSCFPRSHWINGGFMLFERAALEYMAGGDDVHLERQVLSTLATEGQLMMYRHPGYWRSMKTFKDAQELEAVWRESAPWKVW